MKKYFKNLRIAIIALFLVPILATSALANSTLQEMADNSAAWWVAYDAGQYDICDQLHAANEALASGVGSNSYNDDTGSWTISDANGTYTSSGSADGKTDTVTYSYESNSDDYYVPPVSATSYTDRTIDIFIDTYGGTNEQLLNGYNNVALDVWTTDASGNKSSYGSEEIRTSAVNEVAVIKQTLGLSETEAQTLQTNLENAKLIYAGAAKLYFDIRDSGGDITSAEANSLYQIMLNANDAAEDLRATYGYSAGTKGDGGFIDGLGGGGSSGSGSGSSGSGSGTPAGPIAPAQVYHTITANAGIGGTISPSGIALLAEGMDKSYSITANEGYAISEVYVDGTNVGVVASYTFSNVTESHTISVVFKSAAYVNFGSGDVTISDGGSGTMVWNGSGFTTKSGYGFTATASVASAFVSDMTVKADYNFTAPGTTYLEEVGGTWNFPVNAASPIGARKVYVPVETANGTYNVTITVTAIDVPASAIAGYDVYISQSQTVTITINGSMHDDYHTGDNY